MHHPLKYNNNINDKRAKVNKSWKRNGIVETGGKKLKRDRIRLDQRKENCL